MSSRTPGSVMVGRASSSPATELEIPCIDTRLTLDQIYEILEFPRRVSGEAFTTENYGKEWVLVRADTVS